jgi:4-amino-4-deoxy-L-arabinose transferase-like glycosyltransferase
MQDMSTRPLLNRTALLLLALAFALVWFGPLGWRHLVASDEGRYAEMAREMFVTGDWITPRYNGYKYFEKPPLQTWLNALTFAWFGIGEWQARLYTALCGFAGVWLVGFTGTRLFNRTTGLLAALVLASAPYWNLMGHFNTLDMGLSFWMTVVLCALLLAQRPGLPRRAGRGWMWLCWGAMALAVLSKGLIGLLLPGAVLVLYTVLARDWALWKRLYLISGIAVFLLISVPWFILVQRQNPEFLNFFFIVQQFQRYLTPEQNRPGPITYFVPVILVGFLPWLSVAGQSMRHAWRLPRQPNGFAPALLLMVWSAFIFAFFSVSHSKLLSYVLPVAPALALLIGLYLPSVSREQLRRHLGGYLVLLVAGCFGTLFLARLGDSRTPAELYREYQAWVYAALIVGMAATALGLILNRRSVLRAWLAFAFGWLLLGTIAGNGHEIFGRQSSGILLVPAVKAAMALQPANTPFYSVGVLDHTMPFYLDHTMIMVEHPDELQFGVSVEPGKWVPTITQWQRKWDSEPHALALMSPDLYATMAARGVPMQVVARDERRVIVEKPAASVRSSSEPQ